MNPSPSSPPGPPRVLVIAASDPTAGAGVQADCLTLASLGCHPLTAITALTVQDSVGVACVQPVAADMVERQARVVLADMPVAAIKVGVLGSAGNALAVAAIAADCRRTPLVLDPVLASGRGDELAGEAVIAALRDALLPRVTLLTPNAPEARRLAGCGDDAPLAACARRLIDMGARHVLITGGHDGTSAVVNTLYGADGVIRRDSWERLPGGYHGSGCTLASAIAARLAGGADIEEAVREAQEYTWQTLRHAFRAGQGQAIPDRFFQARQNET